MNIKKPIISIIFIASAISFTMAQDVIYKKTAQRLTLENGFVHLEFDLEHPQIDIIKADFTGKGQYGNDLTSVGSDALNRSGIVLEREDASVDGKPVLYASSMDANKSLSAKILVQKPTEVSILVSGIVDNPKSPAVTSEWKITLKSGDRMFDLETNTQVINPVKTLASLRISTLLSLKSVNGFFSKGVIQMMNSESKNYFASNDTLQRFYALGGNGCIDMVKPKGQNQTVLISRNTDAGGQTALIQVLAGVNAKKDVWTVADSSRKTLVINTKNQWKTKVSIAANNYDFPVSNIPAVSTMPFDDLRGIMTAVYATTAATLVTYEFPGLVSVGVAAPWRCYYPGFNFFDPDGWSSVCTLIYSGDSYLINQARTLIEKSGNLMSEGGQIPHHFDREAPTYVALSGSSMVGPNLFWIASALQYAKNTGDKKWLKEQMPKIEKALRWVTTKYNPIFKMINASGPLWIDVFIRENFTSDSNAFIVYILNEMAKAQESLDEKDKAAANLNMAKDVKEGMNKYLWADDHYITQINFDGTKRDFLDYDANLLAVACGVAPPERAKLVLDKLDRSPCMHTKGNYPSEKYYGAKDCYNGNTGDSDVAFGRFAWGDAHARVAVEDKTTFENIILNPIKEEVLTKTWLTERYNCKGEAVRSTYYHEYPEILTMLLREVAYGINIGLTEVNIAPLTRTDFQYKIGNTEVNYSKEKVSMNLPGNGDRKYILKGLNQNGKYEVTVGGKVKEIVSSDESGIVSFVAPIGTQVQLKSK
jgi:hypothetical protein